MRPSKIKKKTMEWKKRPAGVGQPPTEIVKRPPKSIWVNL